MKKREDSLQDLWNMIKQTHIHVITRVSEREEREKGAKNLFIEMTSNVHGMEEETNIQTQEAQSNHQIR